jgi:Fe2+-dicitrate sensor, membrane component
MKKTPNAVAELIAKYLNNDLNDQEKQELDQWVQQSEAHQQFFQQLTGEASLAAIIQEYETSKVLVLDQVKAAIAGDEETKTKVIPIWRRLRKVAAVAASVLLIGTVVVWYLYRSESTVEATPAVVATTTHDKQPATEGAILQLADGKEIVLDDAKDGAIATQGNTQITKEGGLISYNDNKQADKVMYNTLSTPKGKTYKLELSDGSKVWLNAASSIRFPTAFTGWQRNVEITGEVYFEVKKDAEMPFHVTVDQRTTISVLGTSFNVNAYDNEAYVRTTLITGSVKIEAWEQEQRGNSVLLKPGQQALVKNTQAAQSYGQSGPITVVDNANIENVMGWMNGYFSLDDLTLEELMREVERWYDVEVVYEKGIPVKAFFGKVNRDLSLLDFMEGLKDWGVRGRLEGNKLIISGVQ